MGRLTRILATLTRWGLLACAALAVLMALYVGLGRVLVPLVGEYRDTVEDKAAEALGQPVHIGTLEGRWSRLAPVLRLRDVQVGEGEGAVRLDDVRIVPALWRSLVNREARLAQLQVSGLRLLAKEDANGVWSLEGLPKGDDQPTDPGQALQRLQQLGRVDVVDSQLTLHPHDRDPLTLTYVELGLRAGSTQQRLDLRATLPDGQPLTLSARSEATVEQWRDGSLNAYLNVPHSDWARWLPPAMTGEWRLQALQAGGELWIDWAQGRLQSAVARLQAPHLEGAYASRKPVSVDDVSLSAWLRDTDTGYQLVMDPLTLQYDDTAWQTHLQARQTRADSLADTQWLVQADAIDLAPLTPLIQALAPLPKAAMATVDALKVTGRLHNVQATVRPHGEGDQRLAFAANLDQVGFDAYHGAPAARNVSGSINGDLGHGELRLATDDFMLHLDPIFAKPWHYQKADARLTWQLNQDVFTLVAPYIQVKGEEGDIAADFLIRIHLQPGHEDYMDLRVGLRDGDGRYTAKYLPAVLSPALDEWLRTAIIKGAVDEGYFQYQGSLNHDAPAHARNISLFFKVHDAALDFQPGWPHVQDVAGKVYIDDAGVRIKAERGRLLDTQVSHVKVDIPHAVGDEPSHLKLTGEFDGSLGDGLKILKQAPIGTGEIFAGWQGSGPLKGDLALDIPLEKGHEPKVKVDFATQGARLKIDPPTLDLTELKGQFSFDYDKGLSGRDVSLRAFGQSVTAQLFGEGRPGQMQTRIVADGQMPLKTLTNWLKFDQTLPAAGTLPYRLQVELGSQANRLTVDSNLQGLSIDLPAPFGKATGDSRDAQFTMDLQGQERRFDARYVDLARLAYAAPENQLTQGRGELLLGDGQAQLPVARGLRVRGRLDYLDLSAWQQQGQRLGGGEAAGNAQQFLQSVDLHIDRIKADQMTVNQAWVRLARTGGAWQAQVDSREIVGEARVPDNKQAPMDIRLRTLRLPAADSQAEPASSATDPLAKFDPRDAPVLNLAIDQLYRGNDLFGSVAVKLRPTSQGVALNDIDLNLKGLRIDGQAGWDGPVGRGGSWYKGRLSGADLADILKAWDFAPSVTSRSFRLDVDGRWPGSPAAIDLSRFSGSLDASLRSGRFVEVDGGAQALRIFGLLNFNTLGRRLRLDFSDLFDKGLAYDRVQGVLAASDGVYVTRTPLKMTGPSSDIEVEGTLDLVRDLVNANVQVSLPVTNNLPLAALIVGAPAVGGALFLVDRLIGDKVSRFASVHYRIQGPLKTPKITFVKPFNR